MADAYNFAKAPVPTIANTRYAFRIYGIDSDFETTWKLPNSANPANVVPIPADNIQADVQTFFFGPMSHSLTLRPYRPPQGCCAANTFNFDLAGGMFAEKFGSGEIRNGCCSSDVSVKLPTAVLTGTIQQAFCGLQPRTNLTWSTGEVSSYRGMPVCGTLCGPWRMGFVNSVPSEEEAHNVRYWSDPTQYLDCDLGFLCRQCCACPFCWVLKDCLDCRDRVPLVTWRPITLHSVRAHLLSSYALSLHSSFGQKVFEVGNEFLLVGTNATQHLSDTNALGNYRLPLLKRCCCKYEFSDPNDTHDFAEMTGFDLMMRGTFNQNELSPADFNLALGYLILNAKFFLDVVARGGQAIHAARQTLPGGLFALQKAEMRPVPAGSKMV